MVLNREIKQFSSIGCGTAGWLTSVKPYTVRMRANMIDGLRRKETAP